MGSISFKFQQRKRAEGLTNGMVLRDAALEQLGHKITEDVIITVSAKAEGEEAATWAAECAEKKQKNFSRNSVQFCIPRTTSASGCQNGKAREA